MVALALRSLHLWEIVGTPFFESPSSDAALYERLARQIVGGDLLLERRGLFYLGPLYPYFVAVVKWTTASSAVALHVVQVVLSAASASAVCWLGQRLFERRVGLGAGLGTAAYGLLIFYSAVPLPATLVVFLDLAALGLFVEALRAPAAPRWLAAGLVLGLAATARGNALVLAPFVPLVLIAAWGLAARRRWIVATAWVALGTILAITPVTLRNAVVGDAFVPLTTNLGANLYIGNRTGSDGLFLVSPVYRERALGVSVGDQYRSFRRIARKLLGRADADDAAVSRFWVDRALEDIRGDPISWLRLMGRKTYYYLAAYEVPNNRNYEFSKRFSSVLRWPLLGWGIVLPLALLGIYASRADWRRHAVLLAFLLSSYVGVVTFFVTARYRLPAAPVLILYAVVGALQLGTWVRMRDATRSLGCLAALFALGVWLHAFEPSINFATSYERLGRAYEQQGEPERALEAYDAALSVSPGRPYANYEKGRLLREMGRDDEARKFLLHALRRAEETHDSRLARRVREQLE